MLPLEDETGPTPSALLFYVKQEPRETATAALTGYSLERNQSGQDFHLSCIYLLGFIERPGFSTDSVTMSRWQRSKSNLPP